MRSPTQTEYGTVSLAPHEQQHRSGFPWRRTLVYTAIGGVVLGGVAVIALSSSGYRRTTTGSTIAHGNGPTTATSSFLSTPIRCWQSSRNVEDGSTSMMEAIDTLQWKASPSAHASEADHDVHRSWIRVDLSATFQEILGFGGAFTEAAALQFQKLPREKQEEILTLYFDRTHGAGYALGRVPMGSCDFSVASYSFDDVANDFNLSHFDMNVQHDTVTMIPFIQRALDKNPSLKLFLSPWSPPAWMKRPDPKHGNVSSMLGSAQPVGLKEKFQRAWALYFSKFITAYQRHGVPFWGLTPQNEPEFAAPWEACSQDPAFQAEFIAEHLGPVIREDHPDVKIMVFDHNRDSMLRWAKTIYGHPKASQFVDGMAFHWYDGERVMDGVEYHERLNDTHHLDTSRFLLASESCNCPGVASGKEAWFRAQRYAHDIITDLNNWAIGWVDWNLILDHQGGPNHLGNNCDAPIILDANEKDYYLQPMYYFIQHISKFVPPGSRRIRSELAIRFAKPGDPQLYVQYPSALHTCDQSARQLIHRTDDNKLQVTGTSFCIDLLPVPGQGSQVQLVECIYTARTWTFDDQLGTICMKNECLALNHGATEDGVRVVVQDKASTPSSTPLHHQWSFSSGHLHSQAAPVKCVTAGYAQVQASAFATPENKTVLVVLNENSEDAQFTLRYGNGEAELDSSIPAGAIQTYEWQSV